jgi:hypothetical protein
MTVDTTPVLVGTMADVLDHPTNPANVWRRSHPLHPITMTVDTSPVLVGTMADVLDHPTNPANVWRRSHPQVQ